MYCSVLKLERLNIKATVRQNIEAKLRTFSSRKIAGKVDEISESIFHATPRTKPFICF